VKEFRDPHSINPPGSLCEILAHPFKGYKTIELAIFQEHRFAFFYWNKWRRKSPEPPCLITLDWHQDLFPPDEVEQEWLRKLNINNDGEVSVFSWAKLAENNDGHILSAAYINLIGNIYVHCRQGLETETYKESEFTDIHGNSHKIFKFKHFDDLEQVLINSLELSTILDIDLDFFTVDNPFNGEGAEFSYLSDELIIEMLKIDRPLINWTFNRLNGITIATEPEHCGGLLKSNQLLNLVNDIYFEPSLFSPFPKLCNWRHKSAKNPN
jgi:hypothetical protein